MPSDSFYIRQRELIEEYGDYERVVFHCMQSQIRGPRCASIYASQLDEQKHKAYSGTYVLTGGFLGWVYKYKDGTFVLRVCPLLLFARSAPQGAVTFCAQQVNSPLLFLPRPRRREIDPELLENFNPSFWD